MNSRDLTIQLTIALVFLVYPRARAQVYLSCMLRTSLCYFRTIRSDGLPRNCFPPDCFSHFIPYSIAPNSGERFHVMAFQDLKLNWSIYNVRDVTVDRSLATMLINQYRQLFHLKISRTLFSNKWNKFTRFLSDRYTLKIFLKICWEIIYSKLKFFYWTGNCINTEQEILYINTEWIYRATFLHRKIQT